MSHLHFYELLFHFWRHYGKDLSLVLREHLHSGGHLVVAVPFHFSLEFLGNFFKERRVLLNQRQDELALVLGHVLELRLKHFLHSKVFDFSKHTTAIIPPRATIPNRVPVLLVRHFYVTI